VLQARRGAKSWLLSFFPANVRVGFVADPLIVASRGTKVTSICMRISAGSRGLSRNGGNIHVHPDIPFITIRPRIKSPNSQSISPPPMEIRDAVFQELIWISPASNYRQKLVTGPGGLLSRGLLEEHATPSGALPRCRLKEGCLPDLRPK
jgi:hypothetical protein